MEGVVRQSLVKMSLNPEKDVHKQLEDKNSWTREELKQCEENSLKVTSDSEEENIEVDNKEMILKNYQDTMIESGELKVDESVFPLSPSTVGSRSPPPYPGYGEAFQQDSVYFDNRFNTSVNSSMENVYSNTNNQIPVSLEKFKKLNCSFCEN